jgi:hypothetical protein
MTKMKTMCIVLSGLSTLAAGAAVAQTNVGVSVSVHQPGVYGRIDIGNLPPPPVVYAQPVIIARPVHAPPPVYLYVPPGHQKNWRKHCARYHACGQPVYFVRERWVEERYEHEHGHSYKNKNKHKDKGDKHGKGHGRGHDKD